MLGLRSFASKEFLNWKGRRLGAADSPPAIGHGHRHDASILWLFSGGMVWSQGDHREGIHWCPGHECCLCGAYPLYKNATFKGWCWAPSSWPSGTTVSSSSRASSSRAALRNHPLRLQLLGADHQWAARQLQEGLLKQERFSTFLLQVDGDVYVGNTPLGSIT